MTRVCFVYRVDRLSRKVRQLASVWEEGDLGCGRGGVPDPCPGWGVARAGVRVPVHSRAGREAIRLYTEMEAHKRAMQGGDELSLVAKYFGGPSGQGERPARAQYQNDAHRQLAEQVLRRV